MLIRYNTTSWRQNAIQFLSFYIQYTIKTKEIFYHKLTHYTIAVNSLKNLTKNCSILFYNIRAPSEEDPNFPIFPQITKKTPPLTNFSICNIFISDTINYSEEKKRDFLKSFIALYLLHSFPLQQIVFSLLIYCGARAFLLD